MAAIDYNDERFTQVEADKQAALTKNEELYGGMIESSDKFYNEQIEANKAWEEQQKELQKEQTDFAIEKVEQQKQEAEKSYLKEQSGAYKDYQKQTGQHGVNAEQMAANGLTSTGYSESAKVSAYNAYQNRAAIARESYNQAVVSYNNAITEARLQNNAALAEIAYNALQERLTLIMEGFQYKNTLLLEQANKAQELDNTYYGRYQDVLDQINTENALAEQKRQYDEQFAYQKMIDERNYQLQLQELAIARASSGSSSGGTSYKLTDTKVTPSATPEASGSPKYEVATDYYKGTKNSDAKEFGTFSNGYQPKGISGFGKVAKTGKTVRIQTQTLSGETKYVNQNIWQTMNGMKWLWDGRKNCYVPYNGY